MPKQDIGNVTRTDLSSIADFSIDSRQTDGITDQTETTYMNEKFTEWHGYYKGIPELQTAINAFATWVLGKGFTTDVRTDIVLDNVIGWGEDTFQSILWNMLVTKKVHGDAYAEIIRNEENRFINLKPLDPSTMTTVVNQQGQIVRYEQRSKLGKSKQPKRFKPNDILHLVNNRFADEIHGTGVVESVKWIIDARNEAMRDWKRVSHRSTIRVMYIEWSNKAKLNRIRDEYRDVIEKGELMILPGKKGEIEFEDLTVPPIDSFLRWIQYLEDFFYQAVGVPKVILGGSSEFTEASAKISYLTYEQVYTRETTELEADLWNQLGIRLTFNKPVSLRNETLSSEEKNTGQANIQPADTEITQAEAGTTI